MNECVICAEPTTETIRSLAGDCEGVMCTDCQYRCDGNILPRNTPGLKDRSIRYTGPGCGYKFDIEHRDHGYATIMAELDRVYAENTLTARDRYLNLASAAYWQSIADTRAYIEVTP